MTQQDSPGIYGSTVKFRRPVGASCFTARATVTVHPPQDTAMTFIVAILLSFAIPVRAFAPDGPDFSKGIMRGRTSETFARATAAPQIPATSTASRPARGAIRRSMMTLGRQEAPSWRYQIDDLVKAVSPWGSSVEAEIIATDLFKQLPEMSKDVTDAVRRGKLLSEVVLAEGTEARFTVEGLRAVNRQLREDILPQAIEATPRIGKAVSSTGTRGSTSSVYVDSTASTPTSTAWTRRKDARAGPFEEVAETLYGIRNAAKALSPKKLKEGIETVTSEVENVVSRKPRGLYSPEYSIEDTREGFEIRRYTSYAVCSAPMAGVTSEKKASEEVIATTAGSSEGFNTLAGYLFGNNTQERAMDMTTPVNIDVTQADGRTMSFVMPKYIPAGKAPTPRDPRIAVTDVAEGELLAVREFPGFATDGEVKRQLESLLGALEREATCAWLAENPSGRSYRLMQFNPPYTLPWRRSNAIAVRVTKLADSNVASTTEGVMDGSVDVEVPSVAS